MSKPVAWCNANFDQELVGRVQRGLVGHDLALSGTPAGSNLVPGGVDRGLDTAEIAFGQPSPDQLLKATSVRWIHLTSAGYTRYDEPGFRDAMRSRGTRLTTSSQVYADPCAEHALSFLLSHGRRLHECMANQSGAMLWQSHEVRSRSRLLAGQVVLILGYGAIARRLIELLAPLGPEVVAVRRTVVGDEVVPTITADQLDSQLGRADHVVNALPLSGSTRGFLSKSRLAEMKATAAFHNVGRGDTVDQDALAEALVNGRLAAAYLDVTSPEPLPPRHLLWTLPNCVITPHSAGGHTDEPRRLVEHFLLNYARYTGGRDLLDRVI